MLAHSGVAQEFSAVAQKLDNLGHPRRCCPPQGNFGSVPVDSSGSPSAGKIRLPVEFVWQTSNGSGLKVQKREQRSASYQGDSNIEGTHSVNFPLGDVGGIRGHFDQDRLTEFGLCMYGVSAPVIWRTLIRVKLGQTVSPAEQGIRANISSMFEMLATSSSRAAIPTDSAFSNIGCINFMA